MEVTGKEKTELLAKESDVDVSGKADRESDKQLTVKTVLEDSMEGLMQIPIKRKVSVFLTRRIGFSKKVSEDSVCDDTASSDEYLAVSAEEYNNHGGG